MEESGWACPRHSGSPRWAAGLLTDNLDHATLILDQTALIHAPDLRQRSDVKKFRVIQRVFGAGSSSCTTPRMPQRSGHRRPSH